MSKNFSIKLYLTTYTSEGDVISHTAYDNTQDTNEAIYYFEESWETDESWSVKTVSLNGEWVEIDRSYHYFD